MENKIFKILFKLRFWKIVLVVLVATYLIFWSYLYLGMRYIEARFNLAIQVMRECSNDESCVNGAKHLMLKDLSIFSRILTMEEEND
jgi:hypothetical protein